MKSHSGKQKSGGTGVSPVQSFKITRRTLPHRQDPGRVYFVTWRCKKGEVLSSEERTGALEALRYWDGRKWTPLRVHQINRFRGHRGSLWQDERFDRIVRDEAEFLEKWQYIMNNPLKQELVQKWEDYPWFFIKNDEKNTQAGRLCHQKLDFKYLGEMKAYATLMG